MNEVKNLKAQLSVPISTIEHDHYWIKEIELEIENLK